MQTLLPWVAAALPVVPQSRWGAESYAGRLHLGARSLRAVDPRSLDRLRRKDGANH